LRAKAAHPLWKPASLPVAKCSVIAYKLFLEKTNAGETRWNE
jgi:hypothetical protein